MPFNPKFGAFLKFVAGRVLISGANGQITASPVTSGTLALMAPAEYNAGNSGTAKTIDWANGWSQKLAVNGSVTLTLSNPTTGVAYILKLTQTGGSNTVTWPSAVKWAGSTPTFTATDGRTDLVNLYFDGTYYLASLAQGYNLS